MSRIKHIDTKLVTAAIGVSAALAAAVLYAQSMPGAGSAPKAVDTVQVAATYPLPAAKPIPIAVSRGVSFTITLPSNPTTGYSWVMPGKLTERVLRKTSSKYVAPAETNPPRVGQGGVEVWTFTAVGPGTQTVILNYARPWEKNKPPAKVQRFRVRVE